jgi:hypothetical protein
MLFDLQDWNVSRACIDGLRAKRWGTDDRLLLLFFRSMPMALKIAVLDSIPASRAGPRAFAEMFGACYRARPADEYWEPRLARSLRSFLGRRPAHARRFKREMIRLIRSRDPETAALSVTLVALLPRVTEEDVDLVLNHCGDRYRNLRMNAFNTLTDLAKRARRGDPKMRQLLRSRRARVERLAGSERDRDVRSNAAGARRELGRC